MLDVVDGLSVTELVAGTAFVVVVVVDVVEGDPLLLLLLMRLAPLLLSTGAHSASALPE